MSLSPAALQLVGEEGFSLPEDLTSVRWHRKVSGPGISAAVRPTALLLPPPPAKTPPFR